MRAIPWLLGATVLASSPPNASASFVQEQETRAPEVQIIPDQVSCDTCVIERYLVATIHDRAFRDGALIFFGLPHVNSDGTFLVIAGPPTASELYLAEPDGSIVRRIGRAGDGPGEYRRVSAALELPEAYFVFDQTLRRVTRLSKTTLEALGTTQLHLIQGAVPPLVFEDGSLLFSGTSRTRSGIGHPFHLLDSSGQLVRSFGVEEVVPPSQNPYPGVLARSRDGAFWAAFPDRYQIERWDREGNLLAVIQPEADWFTNEPDREKQQAGARQSRVQGLFEDEDGLLWVHIIGRQVGEKVGGQLEPDPSTSASIIEVIDPVVGTLVASSRVEGLRDFWAYGGFFQMVNRESPQGLLTLEVWGARLRSESSPNKDW